ncbi:MAG: hypothetical protein QW175_06235, partial [Candidatus Bathyarchaeia archaeon]
SRLTETAKGFDDIIQRAKTLEASTRSSWLRDACRVLYDLLERLKAETGRVETVPKLKLYPGLNRMCINEFSLEAQQLIVRNAFEAALRHYTRNLILVIDEAFKFLPQNWSSAASRAIMNVITQGAKTGLYVWIATQFLAVTDKDPLKACAVKFLGTQDHPTEIKHTLELIPEARGKFSADDIMKLKLGHWILVRKRPPFVGIVYSLPLNVPENIGVEVAKGLRTPENVRDEFLKPKIEEGGEDLVWKEKFEELERKHRQLLEAHDQLLQAYQQLQEKLETEETRFSNVTGRLNDLAEKYQSLAEDYAKLKSEKAALEGQLKQLQSLNAFREALIEFLKPSAAASEISVTVVQPTLTIQKTIQPLTLTQQTLEGRIAIAYAEGLLPDKAFTTTMLNQILESRFGTKEFPGNLPDALNKFVAWGFLEKVKAGSRWDYRVKIKPEEAKAKGLLKEVEA